MSAVVQVFRLLGELTKAIGDLVAERCHGHWDQHYHVEGGEFMYVVKADNPDVKYGISPVVVKDSEGNTVPGASVDVVVASDNLAAVTVTPDADPHTGTVHFGGPNPDGSPATAGLTATFKFGDKVLAVKGTQIVVTAGDPTEISGGDITLEGLTEAPPAAG